MKLWSESFHDGSPIPGEFAFGIPDEAQHVALSANRNPQLAWRDAPTGTKSFALLVHDPDVPSRGDDVNQPDREVPATLPRVDFFHWSLVDIPASVRAIAAGEHADGVTIGGKAGPAAPQGYRHGLNDFTGWFAGDKAMAGQYFGYDGPCPPWNDALTHRYVFTLYALDIERLAVDGPFTGEDVRKAMSGHVLGEARLTGTYTLNRRLRSLDGRADGDFHQVSCDALDYLEIACMGRYKLHLELVGGDSTIGLAQDIRDHGHAEYLVLGTHNGDIEIRFDHIRALTPLTPGARFGHVTLR
ncbi:YbhB/YbcL family Raf kinase inhibitor-like protein [Jeongeupia wiesaeckerbachi]|uniref:Rho-binding antiterminator n=1 Tax=Jeongeupia wiesaeckerbachi TaxID=3051218 RepID=UPI003D801095